MLADRRKVAPLAENSSEAAADAHESWTLAEVVALAAILAVGGFLRLYRIGELPPGLHQDEAIYGLHSLNVALGNFRMYFGEREPLYMYLVAATSFLTGAGPLALRLTSAIVGSLAVLTTFLAARSLFGRRAALFAGATMATALWPVMISRIGFRAGTLPLVETAALWLLWEGWRLQAPWRSALGGALLGLTLYTYIASRFFPVVLVIFAVVTLLLRRDWIVVRIRYIALSAVAAGVAFAPLGYYFVRHPAAFFGRPAQVAAVGATDPGALGSIADLPANVLRVAAMFFLAGDANWRHNLPGEPAVVLPVALAMLLGMGVALATLRRPASVLLAIWLPAMLAPSALSIDAPHYLRALGAAPAVACAVGLGVAWLGGRISRWRTLPFGRSAITAALLGACLLPGAVTWRDYFVVWAGRPEAHAAHNVSYAAVGRYLAESELWRSRSGRVYVSREFYEDRASLTYFLWPELTDAERRDWTLADARIRWFDEAHAIALPSGGPALVITSPAADAGQLRAVGLADEERHAVSPDGRPGFVSWQLPSGWRVDDAGPAVPLAASGGAGLDLVGYSAAKGGAGESTLALFWRVGEAPPTVTPSVFVHLVDDGGRTIAASDHEVGVATTDWTSGGTIVTLHRVVLPAGAPGGEYSAEVGLYERESLQRQTLRVGERSDSRVVVGPIEFDRRGATRADVRPMHSPDAELAPGVRLFGFDRADDAASPGARVPIVLYWEATSTPNVDYSVEIGLLDGAGREISVRRRTGAGGRQSSSNWPSGEIVRDGQEARIDPTTPPGHYTAFVRLVGADGSVPGERVSLGGIAVVGQSRVFDPPMPSHDASVEFGVAARLVGYDLTAGAVKPGDRVKLRLYWQAIAETTVDYKVFTHLLDEAERVQGQQDSAPASGNRPTTGWVAGEYIVDDYELAVSSDASGTLRVEIGLYASADGGRLAARDAGGQPTGDRLVLAPILSVQR